MAEHDQQFNSFQQWVNKASSWLTRHSDYDPQNFRAICFDAKGRLCRNGKDFMRARDEETFPVRWLWPDQVGPLGLSKEEEAAIWPEWADQMLKILRGFGVPCDDEEGVNLPNELSDWLTEYEAEVRRVALQNAPQGDVTAPCDNLPTSQA